jgi:hypothetical protein
MRFPNNGVTLQRNVTPFLLVSSRTKHEGAICMNNYGAEGVKYGVSFGTALAIAISYTNNQSILWAIIHGIFSWLYVIYFALFK